MQGSFEKKVQDKLEELKLTPSAPVWENIEAQIKKEKKRRVGLFWIPLGIILLAGAGWWLWQPGNEKTAATTATTDTAARQEESSEKQEAVSGRTTKVISANAAPGQKKSSDILARKSEVEDLKKESGLTVLIADRKAVNKEVRKKGLEKFSKKQKATRDSEQLFAQKPFDSSAPQETAAGQKEDILLVDSNALATPVTTEEQKVPVTADTVTAKPRIASAAKKWKLNINLQAGWSGAFSQQGTSSAGQYLSAPQNLGSNSSNSYDIPNSVRRGTAYAIGIGVSRSISQRLQVSLGLRYAFWRTHTRVGSFRPQDTVFTVQSRTMTVDGYYSNGSLQDYTNRYHLLEVPVSLDYKVLRSLPLMLSAGVAYGRLLQSNALSYNRAANFYYYNRQALSHNQFSVFSSLQYGLLNNENFRLHAGPVVQYQLTPFQKDNGSAKQRLLFAGVKATVQF